MLGLPILFIARGSGREEQPHPKNLAELLRANCSRERRGVRLSSAAFHQPRQQTKSPVPCHSFSSFDSPSMGCYD